MRRVILFHSFLIAAVARDCSIGGSGLCSCSELMEKQLIKSIDDCTQTAAMAACKAGTCAYAGAKLLRPQKGSSSPCPQNGSSPTRLDHRMTPMAKSEFALPYKYHNDVGPLDMSWGFPTADVIEIEFTLPSDFYIGLGFTGSGIGDTVAGWVSQGQVHVGDYWDAGSREPDTDQSKGCKNDIEPVSGHYINGLTTVRFRRKLVTGDKGDCDVPIVKGPMDIVYAWCDGEWCFDYKSGCKAYAEGCIDMPHSGDASNHITVDFSGKGSTMLETDVVV